MMKRCLLILILMMLLSGCHKNEEIPLVDQIDANLSIASWTNQSVIDLPSDFDGVTISWESLDPTIVTNEGVITRVYSDTPVTLIARYTFNGIEKSKSFILIVQGKPLTNFERVSMDADLLVIPELVDKDILLPTRGHHDSMIIWESSHPHIISKTGKYYMPIDQTNVILTATILFEDQQITKSFTIIAQAMPDEEKVARDYVMLDVSQNPITQDLLLPSRGYFTSDITWTSSHASIIDDQGHYVKPIGNQLVTLTATITKGESMQTKSFTIPVEGYSFESFFLKVEQNLAINHGIQVIFDDLVLPNTILDIASITWESSHPNIISETGTFVYPDETEDVTLKAHVTSGDFEQDFFFTYRVYGKNDQQTEVIAQGLTSVPLNPDVLFHLDDHEKLSLGIFDHLMMRRGRLLIQGGYQNGTYISPILHSELPMNRINFMWGSISSKTAKTEFFTRYLLDNNWTPWISHGVWGYDSDNLPPSITAHFAQPTQDIQYKILLTKDDLLQPSPEVTFVSIQPVFLTKKEYTFDGLRTSVLYDVPQLKQADTIDTFLWNNICWATSISMMLQYHNKLKDLDVPQEYYSVLIRQGTERFGTTKNDIGATQFGVVLHELEFHSSAMLLHVLDHYGPLIVGVSKGESPDGKFGPLTYSSGHVIVVVGYEMHTDGSIDIIVNDPAVSWMRYTIRGSLDEFMLVWDKGAMLMTSTQ